MKDQLFSLAARTYARLSRPDGLVVATFHRFGGVSGIHHAHVRHHLSFMAQHYEMILPHRFHDRLQQGATRLAMATVDDCHRDIYTYLYPAAKALNVPFVICVPTDFLLRREWLWFDLLYWMLERAAPGATITLDGHELVPGRKADLTVLKRRLKGCMKPERDALLADIGRQLGLKCPVHPQDGYEATSEAELREMLDSGLVEICAHTVSHTIATILPPNAFAEELARCKRELESFAEREISSFCYPNGEHGDFSDQTTQAVREAGFKLAFTSVEGDNSMPPDLFRIRRIHAHPTVSAFEREVSGLIKVQHWITGRWRGGTQLHHNSSHP